MRVTALGVVVCLILSLGGGASADVLELKDGRRIEGKLKGASPAVVAIDVAGRTVVFEFSQVRALYFGDAPPAPPVAASPPAGSAPPQPPRGASPPPPAGAPPPPQPDAAPPPPSVAAPAPSTGEGSVAGRAPAAGGGASAALAALHGLKDAVAAGVSFRDYTPLVIKARASVQTYLQNPAAPESELKAVMNAAMGLYTLAGQAWGARLRKAGYESLSANPAADLCPGLMEKLESAREQGLLKPTPLGQGIGLAAGLPQIWACAGDKVDEATRLLARVAR
jgi:hypothetical protein